MSLSTIRRDERGIALPVAIFALVVIGTLVAGVFFTARLELRGGESAMSSIRAAEAAQAGLQVTVPNTITLGSSLIDGQSLTGTSTQIGTSASYYTYTITRLNKFVFLVRSLGEYKVGSTSVAKRTMATIVKRYMPELNVNSGAIVAGAVTIQGAVTIDGNDNTPASWTGCSPGAAQPAVRSDSTVTVQGGGPSITPSVSSNDTTVPNMSRVLDTLFMQLAGQANITFTTDPGAAAPVDTTIGGVTSCNASRTTNWGDIVHTGSTTHCYNYYPLVYLNAGGPGNQIGLHGGSGQGILLVNGDLKMNGNFTYDGLILVRGTYQTGGGTMNLTGSMLSSLVDTDPNRWNGSLSVQYSSCAINNSLGNLSVSAPATYRSFMQF